MPRREIASNVHANAFIPCVFEKTSTVSPSKKDNVSTPVGVKRYGQSNYKINKDKGHCNIEQAYVIKNNSLCQNQYYKQYGKLDYCLCHLSKLLNLQSIRPPHQR